MTRLGDSPVTRDPYTAWSWIPETDTIFDTITALHHRAAFQNLFSKLDR